MDKKVKRTTKAKFIESYKSDEDGAIEYLQSILHTDQLENFDLDVEAEGDYFLGYVEQHADSSYYNHDIRILVEWIDCAEMKKRRIFTDVKEYGSSWVDGSLYPKDSLILFKIKHFKFDFAKKKPFIIINEGTIRRLNRSLESLRAEKKQIDGKLSLEEEIKNLEKEKEEKSSELDEKIQEIEKKNQKLADKEKEILAKKSELEFYKLLGLKINLKQDKENHSELWNGTLKALIDHIMKYAKTKNHLYYSREIIQKFVACLLTNQIIILAGKPGTGKTSLPSTVADAIGAECNVISVQPNWTDNQDLLGYYNAMYRKYCSTEFLDALIEAKEHPEKIYFICLDEMNLAHVEYYFSSFLSAMERDDRKIYLYSKRQYKSMTEDIARQVSQIYYDEFMSLNDEDKKIWIEEHTQDNETGNLINQWNELIAYPAVISIPENVQIVGTLNMDETTKGLSPKVIDRSFLIEISDCEEEISANEMDYLDEKIQISPAYFAGRDMIFEADWVERVLYDLCKEWNKIAEEEGGTLGARISKRSISHIFKMHTSEDCDENDFIDGAIEGKILPALIGENISLTTMKRLLESIQAYSRSYEKLEKMYDKQMLSFDFWGR